MVKGSIRNKLILFLLLSIIIPISLSIFITYSYTKESMKEQYIKENSNLIHMSAINIMDYMNRLNEATLQIYTNLYDPNSLHQLIQKNPDSYMTDREIYRIMQLMSNSMKEMEQIYIYSAKGDLSYRYAHKLLRSVAGKSYEIPLNSAQDTTIEPLHKSHQYGIAKPKFPFHTEEDVITIHRHINDAPSDEILGTFSVDVRLDAIQSISEAIYTAPYEELYIFNGEDQLILSSQTQEELNSETDHSWLQHIREKAENAGSYHFKDKEFNGMYMYEHIKNEWLDWTIVKRIPYDYLYRDARQLTLINSLVLLLFLVIAVIAALYISLRFTNPIKQLLRYINKVELGNMGAVLEINRTDELGILAKRFQQLIGRINQLIVREYRLELANKTNELKALQAQINPHFMNNALQSIGTLALQQGDKKIYSLISSLGRMMRYQMNTNLTSVPLSAEVDYVKHYLALQQQRFDEQLRYTIELDPACKDVQVPKMILQPIVENYFKHGFQTMGSFQNVSSGRSTTGSNIANNSSARNVTASNNSVGNNTVSSNAISSSSGNLASSSTDTLHIRCYLKPAGHLCIEVADNGAGIEPQRMQQLQRILDSKGEQFSTLQQQSEHIGLTNVLARLRLFFDEHAAIELKAQEPHGLLVALNIQLDEEGADQP